MSSSSSSSSSWRPGSAASDAASQSDPSDVEEEVFVAAMNSPGVQILGATCAVDASVRESDAEEAEIKPWSGYSCGLA